MSYSTSNKKTRGAKTNQKKKKRNIYKQVNNLQTCKKEETQEPKRQRCRTPSRYECSNSGAKTPRREKSNSLKGTSKKRWDKRRRENGENGERKQQSGQQKDSVRDREKQNKRGRERERGERKTKSSYVSRDKTATGERRSSQCSLCSLSMWNSGNVVQIFSDSL